MHRLRTLFILLSAAWDLWRAGFDPDAIDEPGVDDYTGAPGPEPVIWLMPSDQNAVHHADPRRRMH